MILHIGWKLNESVLVISVAVMLELDLVYIDMVKYRKRIIVMMIHTLGKRN